MPRLVRPLLLLLAVILMLAIGRSDGREIAPGSRPEMQTPAPTGTIVVKLTPEATATDRQRLAGLAAAPAVPRLGAELMARAVAKSRRAPTALADLARYIQFDATGAGHDQLVRLVARLAADPAFHGVDLERATDPQALIGRAAEQVDQFIADVVAPIRRRYPGALDGEADIDV